MENDLSGGLNPSFEYFQLRRPGNLQMRDSATLWIIDQSGQIALPRVSFDAIGESWDTPCLQLNAAHADGRILRIWEQQPGGAGTNTSGNAAIRNAGGLRFECIEPFRRWSMDFGGEALQSTTVRELTGPSASPHERDLVPLSFHIEAEMVAPPWLMGAMTEEAARQMKADDGDALMDGMHIEGKVLLSMFDHHNFEMADASVLHQGTARYSWDGEDCIGLIERCTLREDLGRDDLVWNPGNIRMERGTAS